ncbi:uncharacterized protein LOC142332517 [Lycorma delicatula]|uniref:uncharacterized protein LOC142332517 n=1 Tax=Lycorma delicatula TaxID=130591 RepID=UPI003F51563B
MDSDEIRLHIILPSNEAWRVDRYYFLIEKHRRTKVLFKNRAPAVVQPSEMAFTYTYKELDLSDDEDEDKKTLVTDKRPRHSSFSVQSTSPPPPTVSVLSKLPDSNEKSDNFSIASSVMTNSLMSCMSTNSVFWNTGDLKHAIELFLLPKIQTPVSLLHDLEQMRRVFTLIYDVLRYKSVLEEALQSVNFFQKHPKLENQKQLIWLLFYDLYKRDFQSRSVPLEENVNGFELSYADRMLWNNRVKLGATLSKMRIKNKAYDIEDLLPSHLKNSKSNIDDTVVTGWINVFKVTLHEVFFSLDDDGFSHLPPEEDTLYPLTYKLDHLLPRYIHCCPNIREEFVQTSLFLDNEIIMQERTFCIAPAILAQITADFELSGNVVQTHVSSLPTVAYLANLLATNEQIEALLVFGAGERKNQCEEYLNALGVNNTIIFSENFNKLFLDPNNILENVVGVLATPPNTNSNVLDPVDLAVSRGGDLNLLQQLTDDTLHDSSDTGLVVEDILTEQRDTLRVAMSKPQIQFVVYETHSRYDVENSDMAVRVITEMNGYATEKHLEEIKKSHSTDEFQQQQESEEHGGVTAAVISTPQTQQPSQVQQSTDDTEELSFRSTPSISVPPCDLFELASLPDLCPESDYCLDTEAHGTYVAVIKRKEITRLDPKYMIQMAESRGLFGRKSDSKLKLSKDVRKKASIKLQISHSSSDTDSKYKSKTKVEINRIAAPTHSSNLRDKRNNRISIEELICKRHVHHLSSMSGSSKDEIIEVNFPRKWWQELAKYIFTQGFYRDINLPRLKLTRPSKYPVRLKKRIKKVQSPFPIHVNYIEFSSNDSDTDCIQLCPCLILSSYTNSLYTSIT